MSKYKVTILLIASILITACSEGPGQLEGTWKMHGVMPLTVTYRDGEEESMGLITKVTYKHEENDVLVTYVDGLAKGTTMRVKITGPNTAVTGMGKLTRIK
jgi:hypothetical protein